MHPAYHYRYTTVVAAEQDIQVESGLEQTLKVSRIVPHPNYTGTNNNYQNDICILRLLTPIRRNSMTKEIPMANTESQVGQTCVISGWGSTRVKLMFHAYTIKAQY